MPLGTRKKRPACSRQNMSIVLCIYAILLLQNYLLWFGFSIKYSFISGINILPCCQITSTVFLGFFLAFFLSFFVFSETLPIVCRNIFGSKSEDGFMKKAETYRCYVYSNKIKQDATVARYLFTAKSLHMFRVSIETIIWST